MEDSFLTSNTAATSQYRSQTTACISATSTPYTNNAYQPTVPAPPKLEEYLSEEEIQAVNVMRQQMQQEGFNVPDERLVQALMARKFEVDRAVSLLKNQITWKKEHASDIVLDQTILKELRTCKVITPPNARDRTGAQIVYFSPRLHEPSESTPYDVFRMSYFMIDRLVPDIQTQRNGFLIIVDMQGAGWRNFDRKLPSVFVHNMQNKFPARLHLVLMLNPPRIFKMMYKLVKPFVPEKYLMKIKVIDPQQLQEYIDPNNLLQQYGGDMAFDQSIFINDIMNEQQQQKQPQQILSTGSGSV